MSTPLVSAFYDVDVGDFFYQSRNSGTTNFRSSPTSEQRKIVGAAPTLQNTAFRPRSISAFTPTSVSGKTSPSLSQLISITDSQLQPTHHRLDRTLSEPIDRSQARQAQQNVNSSRYKTEMCRPFEESGHCKYGDKCQFAHGAHEIRSLSRHPKYKTELCRTFHTTGYCPYGPRCHFIHSDAERVKMNQITKQQAMPSQLRTKPGNFSLPLGSTADSPPSSISGGDSPSLSPTFLSDDVFSLFSPLHPPPASAPVQLHSQNFIFPDMPPSPTNFQQHFQSLAMNQMGNTFITPITPDEDMFGAPPSPPLYDDSNTCCSPLDVSRGLRLPVFSRLSLED